ncbi:MAG TPA: DNA primase [Rhodanobacteraceae bacterium]|nr:DNA primase [Rhodanobacteraceae bacterium]
MPGLIPDSFIDDLLTRVDIVDVVERRVPMKKAGREWTACCPFHNERTPSFYVSPQKQFYHCFGCGAHGSAIRFLMEYEHLDFPDAVEELAQTVGVTVPREGGHNDRPREDRSGLYQLLDNAAGWYQQQLAQSPEALAYCERRGIDAATAEAFRIGWAPERWDGVLGALGSSAERTQWLEQAGMLSMGQGGKKYDRFRGRLMFPIMDRRGRVIAFGGRVLDGDGPKYLNSPETPLFHKGRELFALWQVKQANSKLERLLVVEGYMDAIALHQAGLPIAVATLGTATTPEHAERLFRSAPEVIFCFDGDRAGRAAAWKALEAALPCLRDGRQAGFLFLPEGEDPDSLVRAEGKDGFSQRMSQAMPLSDYLFDTLGKDINTTSLDGRARLAEQARPLIARLPDGVFRDLMGQELEKRTGAQASPAHAPARRATSRANPAKLSLVRQAVTLLLAEPSLADNLTAPYPFAALDKPGIDLLTLLVDTIHEHPGIHTAGLLEHFRDRPEYDVLQKLAATPLIDNVDLGHEFQGALTQMQRQIGEQRIADLLAQQSAGGLSDAEKSELRELLKAKATR